MQEREKMAWPMERRERTIHEMERERGESRIEDPLVVEDARAALQALEEKLPSIETEQEFYALLTEIVDKRRSCPPSSAARDRERWAMSLSFDERVRTREPPAKEKRVWEENETRESRREEDRNRAMPAHPPSLAWGFLKDQDSMSSSPLNLPKDRERAGESALSRTQQDDRLGQEREAQSSRPGQPSFSCRLPKDRAGQASRPLRSEESANASLEQRVECVVESIQRQLSLMQERRNKTQATYTSALSELQEQLVKGTQRSREDDSMAVRSKARFKGSEGSYDTKKRRKKPVKLRGKREERSMEDTVSQRFDRLLRRQRESIASPFSEQTPWSPSPSSVKSLSSSSPVTSLLPRPLKSGVSRKRTANTPVDRKIGALFLRDKTTKGERGTLERSEKVDLQQDAEETSLVSELSDFSFSRDNEGKKIEDSHGENDKSKVNTDFNNLGEAVASSRSQINEESKRKGSSRSAGEEERQIGPESPLSDPAPPHGTITAVDGGPKPGNVSQKEENELLDMSFSLPVSLPFHSAALRMPVDLEETVVLRFFIPPEEPVHEYREEGKGDKTDGERREETEQVTASSPTSQGRMSKKELPTTLEGGRNAAENPRSTVFHLDASAEGNLQIHRDQGASVEVEDTGALLASRLTAGEPWMGKGDAHDAEKWPSYPRSNGLGREVRMTTVDTQRQREKGDSAQGPRHRNPGADREKQTVAGKLEGKRDEEQRKELFELDLSSFDIGSQTLESRGGELRIC